MDDIRRQFNGLWKEALGQLEEARGVLTGRIEGDLVKLRNERDKLLRRLGEQTYRLAHDGKVPLPAMLRRTVDRLSDVIDGLVETEQRKGGKKRASKKGTTRKTGGKKKAAKQKSSAKKASKKKTAAKKTGKKRVAKKKKKTTARKSA